MTKASHDPVRSEHPSDSLNVLLVQFFERVAMRKVRVLRRIFNRIVNPSMV